MPTASPMTSGALCALALLVASGWCVTADARPVRMDRSLYIAGQSLAWPHGTLALIGNPAGLASMEAYELNLRFSEGGVAVGGDRGAGWGIFAGAPLGPLALSVGVEHAADPPPAVKSFPAFTDLSRLSVGAGARFGGWLDVGLAWRTHFGQADSVGGLATLDLGMQISPWSWLALGWRVSDLLGATTFALPSDQEAILGPHYSWGWVIKLLDDSLLWTTDLQGPGGESLATIRGSLQYRRKTGWGGGLDWVLHGRDRGSASGDTRIGVILRYEAQAWGGALDLHRDDDPHGVPVVRAGVTGWARYKPKHDAWWHVVKEVTGRAPGRRKAGIKDHLRNRRVGWKGKLKGGSKRRAAALARAVLSWSGAMVTENVEALCAALAPGQVRFDIETRDPPLVIHRSFGREEACLSLVKGELQSFVHEFGPAFLHAEVAVLLPELFRIHGGPYFRLPPSQTDAYIRRLAEARKKQKKLKCMVYRANPLTILRPAAGRKEPVVRVYEVEMECLGVRNYVIQFAGSLANGFRIRKVAISF